MSRWSPTGSAEIGGRRRNRPRASYISKSPVKRSAMATGRLAFSTGPILGEHFTLVFGIKNGPNYGNLRFWATGRES